MKAGSWKLAPPRPEVARLYDEVRLREVEVRCPPDAPVGATVRVQRYRLGVPVGATEGVAFVEADMGDVAGLLTSLTAWVTGRLRGGPILPADATATVIDVTMPVAPGSAEPGPGIARLG